MDTFPISSDDCLVLVAVSQTTSLREAARELNCDAGGLLRKIQRIASDHQLLVKLQGKWQLTEAGIALVGWTRDNILTQKKILSSDVNIRIGSTMWFAEQVLIPALTDLKKFAPDVTKIQMSVPQKGFEKSLTDGDCDFVIVCHPPEDPQIAHKQLSKEAWSIIAPKKSGAKTMKDLSKLSFIRHNNLNPEVFFAGLVNTEESHLTIDNLIGVRAAVLNGLGWSFIPTALIADDVTAGRLQEVPHEIEMDRKICVWWLRHGTQSGKKAQSICKWVQQAAERI